MGNNLRFSEPPAHLVVNRWMCFYSWSVCPAFFLVLECAEKRATSCGLVCARFFIVVNTQFCIFTIVAHKARVFFNNDCQQCCPLIDAIFAQNFGTHRPCFYYALSVQISSVGATNYLDVCSVAATPRDNKRFHDDLNKIFAFTKEFVSPVEEGTRDVPPIFTIPLPNPITVLTHLCAFNYIF